MNSEFLPIDGKRSKHQSKTSFDSLYSSEYLESFSLSSSSLLDSDKSVNVEQITKKTQEIREIVTNRLTVFLYMSQKWCEGDEVEEFKKSVNKTISFCSEKEEEGEAEGNMCFVKSVLGQITQLQREYERLEKKLNETKDEVLNTEEEKEELRQQMEVVEHDVSNFIVESKEKNSTVCQCLSM